MRLPVLLSEAFAIYVSDRQVMDESGLVGPGNNARLVVEQSSPPPKRKFVNNIEIVRTMVEFMVSSHTNASEKAVDHNFSFTRIILLKHIC